MLYILAAISIATLSTISYLSMSLGSMHEKFYQTLNEKNNFLFVRDYVTFVIKNPVPFQKILQISQTDASCNQSLKCIFEHTDCDATLAASAGEDINGNPATGPTAFHEINCLYDSSASSVIFRSANAGDGLDRDGNACTGYSTTTPHATCVFRPEVRWRPMCTGTPCTNPSLEVRIDIHHSSASKVNLNTTKRIVRAIITN